MTISYIKEVGNRELTIEQYHPAEQAMLPNAFAFGHPNYEQYLTCQHVILSNLHLENPGTWEEQVKEGFSGTLSRQPFS